MFKISECKKIMKKCSKCGIIKTINHYSKDNKKKDKLFNKCKECCKQERKTYTHICNIYSYDWDKEHRTDLNNGVTLCNKCHKEFHKKYGYGNNTKEQFEEFINNITKTA